MKKQLRLLLWEECNRKCEGCCNKQFDLANLPVCTDFSQYELIMLTGGEPMLYPDKVVGVIKEIREQTNVPIYIYTAKVDDLHEIYKLMFMVQGWTVTLHDNNDVQPFRRLAGFFDPYWYHSKKKPSLRVNIFKDVDVSEVPWKDNAYEGWKIKSNIEWIDPCPLPSNEDFMRWKL
jgi:hypothetical protein